MQREGFRRTLNPAFYSLIHETPCTATVSIDYTSCEEQYICQVIQNTSTREAQVSGSIHIRLDKDQDQEVNTQHHKLHLSRIFPVPQGIPDRV